MELKKHGNVVAIRRSAEERGMLRSPGGTAFSPGLSPGLSPGYKVEFGGYRSARRSGNSRRFGFWLLLAAAALIAVAGLWWRNSYLNRPLTVMPIVPFESSSTLVPDISISQYSHIMFETGKSPELKPIVTGLGFSEEVAAEMHAALTNLRAAGAGRNSGDQPAELKADNKPEGHGSAAGAEAPVAAEPSAPPALLTQGQILRFAMGKTRFPSLVMLSEIDRAGHPTEISLRPNKYGKYRATLAVVPKSRRERIAVGVIRTSFSAAARREGVPQDVLDEFVDLFSDRVVFHKDFRPGDRFTLIYREGVKRRGNRGKETGSILAAALEVNNRQLVAAGYVGTDGKRRFFDQAGQMLGNAFLRYPLKFSRISSYFSRSRFHPVLKFSRPHNGVDFAAPIGTPVRTVADGVVESAGYAGGSGNMVKITHGPRYSTAYLHLSRIDRSVRKGARVRRGQVIGTVGMTGLATGAHLHYAFYDNGKYTDPLKIALPTLDSLSSGLRVDRNYLKRVLFTLNHYQTVRLDDFYRD